MKKQLQEILEAGYEVTLTRWGHDGDYIAEASSNDDTDDDGFSECKPTLALAVMSLHAAVMESLP